MDETSEPESGDTSTDHEEPRDDVSRKVLILSVLAAALVAGVVGMAIGWKVEQQRVKEDVANIRPVGRVTAIEDGSLTIDLLTSTGTRTYVLTDETVVDSSATSEIADVVEGSTVLVKNKRDSDGDLEATEIIVLPQSTTFGGRGRGGGGG